MRQTQAETLRRESRLRVSNVGRLPVLAVRRPGNPFAGQYIDQRDHARSVRSIGKPELLKHASQGYWSRRITSEHRIVYKKIGDQLFIAQLRYRYR